MPRVLVTGSNGLCGSALRRNINGLHEFHFITKQDGDLRDKRDVTNIFDRFRPEYVVNTSAMVGGIVGNQARHGDFFYDNILINTNIIKACLDFRVEKLLSFSSVCVFPDDLALLEESRMHDGPVYHANFAYGYAKRMIDVYIRAAQEQYGIKNYCSIISGNIFGKNDLYDKEHGHFIPAMMYKIYEAKINHTHLNVLGDGKSLREFIYADDLARILLRLLDMDYPDKIIVSGRREYSISEIVEMLCNIVGFDGQIIYNHKNIGQRSRPTSKMVLDSLLPDFEYTDFTIALQDSFNWFLENYPNVRTKLN